MPKGIANRMADNYWPLLAVADEIGGEWPGQARRAAIALTGGEDTALPIMLLADIRDLVGTGTKFTSAGLALKLGELEDRPWADFRNGHPITKAQVARMLKSFNIASKTIRLQNGTTQKGYFRNSFDDAFSRYLPDPPPQSDTTSQANNDGPFQGFAKRHSAPGSKTCDGSENNKKANNGGHCDDVTFSQPMSHSDGKTDLASEEV
jgi:hypothetical protein